MTVRLTPGIVVAVTRNRGAVKRLLDLERTLLLTALQDRTQVPARVLDAPSYVDGMTGSYCAVWNPSTLAGSGTRSLGWQR